MNAEQYVNMVIRKIRCGRKKKGEIRKQLLAEINMRNEQGERLEEIFSQMGSAAEIAESFNENLSVQEQKQYSRKKVFKIIFAVAAVLVLLLVLLFLTVFPKRADIDKSGDFEKEQVEEAMKETIELLDRKDYSSLQENAIPQMKSVLEPEMMEKVRGQITEDWGERISFGKAYIGELVQKSTHYAVGEITVAYENVSVTYRLTYDQDMKLAGLYMR